MRLIAGHMVHYLGFAVAIVGFGWFGLRPFETGVDAATSMGIVQVATLDCSPALLSIFTIVELSECGFSALWRLPVGLIVGVLLYAGFARCAEHVGGEQLAGRFSI
jgi:hypothetical protein